MEIRGGIVGRSSVARTASPISVTWQWYNLSQGVVEWEFTNKGNNTAGCLLFRNSYYFGNAFFPVYLANPQFNTSFATAFSPLVDRGAQNNSAPLSVIDFGQNRRIVAFVFILSPGSKWSMLEGGFSLSSPPSGYSAVPCDYETTGNFSIGYDPDQVSQWDAQTNTTMKGYSPNPKEFRGIIEVSVSAEFLQLFPGDSITPL
ncbi:MAG TPA: hypothetical protein VKU79_04555 [Thermoplasmataceae archaeon]|nr:hypothetical protein [Thermoplasmataceae archaeon]